MSQIKEENKTTIQLLNEAEEDIAYNLQWLTDQFDLRIRQGDKDVIERLAMLTNAWRNILKCAVRIEASDLLARTALK